MWAWFFHFGFLPVGRIYRKCAEFVFCVTCSSSAEIIIVFSAFRSGHLIEYIPTSNLYFLSRDKTYGIEALTNSMETCHLICHGMWSAIVYN